MWRKRIRSVVARLGHRVYADLVLMLGCLVAVWLTFAVPGAERHASVRVLRFVFLVFVPGYALTASLFPRKTLVNDRARGPNRLGFDLSVPGEKNLLERAILSIGLSVVVVPLAAFGLDVASTDIDASSLLLSLSVVTVSGLVAAVFRRERLPDGDQFDVALREWLRRLWSRGSESIWSESGVELLIVLITIAGVILSVSAVANPTTGESFTSFAVLSEGDDGQLVAGNYPAEFEQNETRNVTIWVANHENRPVRYTTVVELQRFDSDATTRPVETRELGRVSFTTTDNETVTREFGIDPPITHPRLRVTFLLYRGEPPADPSVGNAYRSVHFWANVAAPDRSSTSSTAGTQRAHSRQEYFLNGHEN
jgi:uncharacterized membrane protein